MLLLTVLLLSLLKETQGATNTLFCYWGSWSTYRFGSGELQANQINPFTCTHLLYAFAGLDSSYEIMSLDRWNDVNQWENGGKDNYRKLVNLKNSNPSLKILLSIGGWNQGSVKFSQMASYANSRGRFVRSVVSFLQRYGFDGLDLAWQWPGSRGGGFQDKSNLILLLKELQTALKQSNLLLSLATPALSNDINTGFQLDQIYSYVDFLVIYSYDYDVSYYHLSHPHPLYNPQRNDQSVNSTISYYLAKGVPSQKILMGMSLYGRAILRPANGRTVIGSPGSGPVNAGPFTQSPGILAWFELCSRLNAERFTLTEESAYGAQYAFNDYQWIAYEGPSSIAKKVKYAKDKNLAGFSVWSLENDDNHQTCGGSLVSIIKSAM